MGAVATKGGFYVSKIQGFRDSALHVIQWRSSRGLSALDVRGESGPVLRLRAGLLRTLPPPGPCPYAPPRLLLEGEAAADDGGAFHRKHLAVDIEDVNARDGHGEGVRVLA
jgi:hypothetical protein